MKPRRIVRGERVTAGLVLTRDVVGLPKGRILSDDDVRALESSSWSELEALELEPSDVHEEVAGQRLAVAVARLSELNLIPDLTVNTHPPQYVALEGNVIGRAKVIPFVTREDRLRRAEEAARGGLVRVRPFVTLRGALLVHEKIAEAALEKARRAFHEKLAFFGSKLESARAVPGNS